MARRDGWNRGESGHGAAAIPNNISPSLYDMARGDTASQHTGGETWPPPAVERYPCAWSTWANLGVHQTTMVWRDWVSLRDEDLGEANRWWGIHDVGVGDGVARLPGLNELDAEQIGHQDLDRLLSVASHISDGS
jgi:hypothetical protein